MSLADAASVLAKRLSRRWYQQHLVKSSPSTWLSHDPVSEPPLLSAPADADTSTSAPLRELVTCLFKALSFSQHLADGQQDRLSALLLLLRLLRAQPSAVAPLFAQHHASIAAGVWHAVTPQLFALLHHAQVCLLDLSLHETRMHGLLVAVRQFGLNMLRSERGVHASSCHVGSCCTAARGLMTVQLAKRHR